MATVLSGRRPDDAAAARARATDAVGAQPLGLDGAHLSPEDQDRATLKAEASVAHPVFWLELNDLLKRFERIDYCDPPPADEIAPAVPVLLP